MSNNTAPLLLSSQVKTAVEYYLAQLEGDDTTNLYDLVLAQVEKPLLEVSLQHAGYNQTKTAEMLGISRSTLRKKLAQYNIK